MHKRSWCERRSEEAVSPVIATILLVGITVVLAATLYVMVFGFGGGSADVPPVANISRSTEGNGFKWTFTPFSKDTTWTDVSIVLTDGTYYADYSNITTEDLRSGDYIKKSFGSRTLGSLTVFLNITDQAGNGYVNQGDFFSLTTTGGTFLNNVAYEVFVLHDPSSSEICSDTFLGA